MQVMKRVHALMLLTLVASLCVYAVSSEAIAQASGEADTEEAINCLKWCVKACTVFSSQEKCQQACSEIVTECCKGDEQAVDLLRPTSDRFYRPVSVHGSKSLCYCWLMGQFDAALYSFLFMHLFKNLHNLLQCQIWLQPVESDWITTSRYFVNISIAFFHQCSPALAIFKNQYDSLSHWPKYSRDLTFTLVMVSFGMFVFSKYFMMT